MQSGSLKLKSPNNFPFVKRSLQCVWTSNIFSWVKLSRLKNLRLGQEILFSWAELKMDISKFRMNPRVAKRRLMCLWTLKFPPQLLPLKAYRRGKLLFECLFVSALTLEHSTIWWKFLGMDPAQSIGIGTRFLPTENVDTSSTIDGEVLRNTHPSCSVWTDNPLSEKVLWGKTYPPFWNVGME